MKTTAFLKLFFFSLALTLIFAACEKDTMTEFEASETQTLESLESVELRSAERRRETVIIKGFFEGEDGITTSQIEGETHQYGMESIEAVFHVTDANSSIITFRSMDYILGKTVKVHFEDCSFQFTGINYTDGQASYLRVDSEEAFNCIAPIHDEFGFYFGLKALKK